MLISSLNGCLPMNVAMRVVYMNIVDNNNRFQARLLPEQDFSITKKELKYMEIPSSIVFSRPIENIDFETQRKTYHYPYNF
jgi:hypothetical protein